MFLKCCSAVFSVYSRVRNAFNGQPIPVVETRTCKICCLHYFASIVRLLILTLKAHLSRTGGWFYSLLCDRKTY